MRTLQLTKPFGITSEDMISPQIHKWIFTFIMPLGLTFPMTRAHVRLLGPCFKTGQADHACFRLQYLTGAKILKLTVSSHHTLRLLVHVQRKHNSYEYLTAINRPIIPLTTA